MIDNQGLNSLFAIVKEARGWLSSQSEQRADARIRTPSLKTVTDYGKVANRLIHGAASASEVWGRVAATTKKSTYFKNRAAILYVSRVNVENLLKAQDQLQRNNGLSDSAIRDEWEKKVRRLEFIFTLVREIPAEPPMEKIERRETKRKNLGKLPEDWRQQIIKRMPKYSDAAAMSMLVGCRPGELERGIRASMKDGVLEIEIGGSKLGEFSGQEWRKLCWTMPTENPLAIIVGRKVLEAGGEKLFKVEDAKAFSGAMRSAGKRAFPAFPETITPYSARHQLASDMKAAGLGDDISRALGHSSADTRGSYGLFAFGKGSYAPDQVAAAREVREAKNLRVEPIQRPSNARSGPSGP